MTMIRTMKLRTRLLLAFVGLGLGLAGVAGASDAGTTVQLDKPPAWHESKDAKVEDITQPDSASKARYALFRNGRVYVVKPKWVKVENVTKADGTTLTRITEGPLDETGVPPLDPSYKGGPTPAQEAEMHALTNPGPPDDPANMKAIVAANP